MLSKLSELSDVAPTRRSITPRHTSPHTHPIPAHPGSASHHTHTTWHCSHAHAIIPEQSDMSEIPKFPTPASAMRKCGNGQRLRISLHKPSKGRTSLTRREDIEVTM